MNRYLLPVVLASVCATPAFAEDIPQAGALDKRVRTAVYNPDQVFAVTAGFRSAVEIVLERGETITNIAVGDSVSWEVAPSGNIIFLKPREHAGPTNMIVTSQMGRETRMYHFALKAQRGAKTQRSNVMFGLRFRYPQADAARAAVVEQQRLQAAAYQLEANAIAIALDAAVTTGPRNLNYMIAGAPELAPTEITDNGVSTVLRFPRNQPVPAIFKVLPDGSESVVNYTVKGEFVVINELVSQLRLRMGDSLSCIWNMAFDPYGKDVSSGTVSPDVQRSVEGN
ncbi:P-type conjugative transfer protein VirB9 [Alterisphingorhabdus coralli]|uniref:P-type conjugative transfer protein VirB9 n=1 Tax=Alterisphingorhabdus coralli TaxID=3071408 RepID=A0AA97FBD8_9SPHN|nr:P-type conjugative transfer protein VirB9 [Parasphingorhabdus sp. SCSIO 66989]WOE76747.1 P-type conjugative transfer protein VirB9 [Parasphingorhabdus sp. SCSIO 66989]